MFGVVVSNIMHLEALATKTNSLSLAKIAVSVKTGGHFDTVLAEIDRMLSADWVIILHCVCVCAMCLCAPAWANMEIVFVGRVCTELRFLLRMVKMLRDEEQDDVAHRDRLSRPLHHFKHEHGIGCCVSYKPLASKC
eukprot:2795649-Amphidinium_carterae.1